MSIESEYRSLTSDELNDALSDLNKLLPLVNQRRPPEQALSTQCCEELYILLTGSPPPMEKLGQVVLSDTLANAVAGGNLIKDSERMDGPFLGRVRYLTAGQVQEIAEKLNPLTYEELSRKNIVESVDDDEMAEEFAAFRDFFSCAAGNGNAVLSYFTD
jgi:hypothetical protein